MRKVDFRTVCLKTAFLFGAVQLVSTLSGYGFSLNAIGWLHAAWVLLLTIMLLWLAFAAAERTEQAPETDRCSIATIQLVGLYQAMVASYWFAQLVRELIVRIEFRPFRIPVKEWYADGFDTPYVFYLVFCVTLICFPGFWNGVIDGLGSLLRRRRPFLRLPEYDRSVLPARVGFFLALGLLFPSQVVQVAQWWGLAFLAMVFAFLCVSREPDNKIQHTVSIMAIRLTGIALFLNFENLHFLLYIIEQGLNIWAVLLVGKVFLLLSLLLFPGFWYKVVIRLGMMLHRCPGKIRNYTAAPVARILPFRLAALMLGLAGLQILLTGLYPGETGVPLRLLLITCIVMITLIFSALLLSAPVEKGVRAEFDSVRAIRILGIVYSFRQFALMVATGNQINMIFLDHDVPDITPVIYFAIVEVVLAAISVSWAVCPAFWNRLLSRAGSFIRKISIRS